MLITKTPYYDKLLARIDAQHLEVTFLIFFPGNLLVSYVDIIFLDSLFLIGS